MARAGVVGPVGAPPPGPAGAHPGEKPGTGRKTATVGLVLAVGAIALIVVSSLVGGLFQSLLVPSTPVVVAARDIPLRSTLGAADVTVAQVTHKDVPPGAYRHVADVENAHLVASISIVKGQPITSNMLVKHGDEVTGPQPAYLPIPQGFVAIAIPTSVPSGVGGFIQVGDYINAMLIIDPVLFQSDRGGAVTKTVFTNLHVIRTGAASSGSDDPNQAGTESKPTTSAGASSLTVVVTQCDAEFLNWLLIHGRLVYTLGSYKDYQPQDKKPDPNCPGVGTAHGVGPAQVQARWHLAELGGGKPVYIAPPYPE